VEQTTDQLKIHGFIGKPEFAKKTRGEQYFFVNGRFIKHPYLNHAVANAYTELIPADSFPSYFLNIDIDPKEIDINIHPTKTEVNFRDARYVYGVLQAAVKQSIGQHSLTPTIDFDVDPSIEAIFQHPPVDPVAQPGVAIDPSYNPFEKKERKLKDSAWQGSMRGDENWELLYTKKEAGFDEKGPEELYQTQPDGTVSQPSRFFQSHNKYILCNVKSGLMVIDQQRAHERILFERYSRLLSGSGSPSQQQLFPHNIHFSPGDAEIVRSLRPDLEHMGFMLEPFGSNGFVVNGIPADMKEKQLEPSLEQIIENHKVHASDIHYDKKVNLARSIAANTSVKEGVRLSEEEMSDIFDRLFACQVPEVTPDGKKTMVIISLPDVDQLMKK
jgi:DNA mismatch repair protein MutL